MRRFFLIAASQFGGSLIGMVGALITTHVVPPGVLGEYFLFLSLAQLGLQLPHSAVQNYAFRAWGKEKGEGGKFLRFLWRVSLKYLAFLSPLVGAFVIILYLRQKNGVWLANGLFLMLGNLGVVILAIGTGLLTADDKNGRALVLNIIGTLLRSVLPVLLAWQSGLDGKTEPSRLFATLCLGYAFQSILVTALGVAIFNYRLPWDRPGLDLARRWASELRDYGSPFILFGIGGWLLVMADRWVVVLVFGEERGGLFALATTLSAFVPTIIISALMYVAFPRIFRHADEAQTREHWKALAKQCDLMTIVAVSGSVIGLICLALISPLLTGWFIPLKYEASFALLLPVGFASLCSQANQFHYLLLQGQHKSGAMIRVVAVLAAVKTVGGICFALVSWNAFVAWLYVSCVVVIVLGRRLIHRFTFALES